MASSEILKSTFSIENIINSFVDSFNVNNLDQVMTFFASNAAYTINGKIHRGTEAIRNAFEPQFRGSYGKMCFDVDDAIFDENARKAVICWVCIHDIGGRKGKGLTLWKRLAYRAVFGNTVGWAGLDVFHFNEQGKITMKRTYTTGRPKLVRKLGRPL